MKNAIDDINAAFTKATGIKAVASLAASSALAKQIEQGAPADVFASADLEWMDYRRRRRSSSRTTRRVNLLGNKLVLIAPKDSKLGNVTIGQGFDIAKLAGDGRIAVGRRARGAGRQIRQGGAGEARRLGRGRDRSSPSAENVRAALALVGRGEAPLGIVYETDAKIEQERQDRRRISRTDSHPPITYPVALTANAKPEAAQYLDFLRSARRRRCSRPTASRS